MFLRKPERKVSAATFTSAVVTFVVAAVMAFFPSVPQAFTDALGDFLSSVVGAAVVAIPTYVVAWLTKHTHRNDV